GAKSESWTFVPRRVTEFWIGSFPGGRGKRVDLAGCLVGAMPRKPAGRWPAAGVGARRGERGEEAAARFRWFVGFAGCWLRLVSEILDVCTPRRGHKRPRSQHGSPATPATTAQTGQTGPPAHPSPPGTGPTRQ